MIVRRLHFWDISMDYSVILCLPFPPSPPIEISLNNIPIVRVSATLTWPATHPYRVWQFQTRDEAREQASRNKGAILFYLASIESIQSGNNQLVAISEPVLVSMKWAFVVLLAV